MSQFVVYLATGTYREILADAHQTDQGLTHFYRKGRFVVCFVTSDIVAIVKKPDSVTDSKDHSTASTKTHLTKRH
jgi:hypothetical protein